MKSFNEMSTGRVATLITGVVAVLILLFSSFSLVEDVPNDQVIVNQVPITGEIETWYEPGMRLQKWGETTKYKKAFQFWFGSEGKGEPRKIVFNDAGIGHLVGSIRVRLPRDPKNLKQIQAEFGSQANLERELIAPTVTKVIFATGPLMSSYESYAAKKNDLINHIEDQLQNGIYKTQTKEITTTDPLTGETKTRTVSELVPSDDPGDAGYARQENPPFKTYGIDIAQISVDDIEYAQVIRDQIAAQQRALMEVKTAMAEAKKAEQNAEKAKAIGEQKIAEARAEQSVRKEKAIVQAEQKAEVARLAKVAAAHYKEEQILKGQGEAQRKRLVMEADGALQQKLATYEKVMGKFADMIANYKGDWVPRVQMSGGEGTAANGGNNAAMNLIEMLSVKTAQELSLDPKINKGDN